MAEHESSTSPIHIWLHVHSALLGIIFLAAVILNSLLIFVLHKMKSRRSNRDCASYNIERSYMYLLFHLALADMLGVLLNIPFDIFRNADIQYYFSSAGCKILPPFQLSSTTAQAGTYVALSYHRFRAIVHPIRAKLTVYKSLFMIAIIWMVSVTLSLPYVIVLKFDETSNSCGEVWNEKESGSIYTFAIFVVQYAAPVILMAVFYISIARTLHEHRMQKELVHVPTQDDVRSHKHIVKMLVTIVTVYGVCMLPHHLFWIVIGVKDVDSIVYKAVSSASYLFTYSNSVANPIIFFFYNKESRYHIRRFFKQLCCARNLDVPFEIKKWSATWSANSRSDSQRTHEKRSSKDHLKLDQMFLARPGDSELGVSLPWEAQVMHSHGSSEENYRDYPTSLPRPDLTLSPDNPKKSPETTNPFLYCGLPEELKKYPSDTTLDIVQDYEFSMKDNTCTDNDVCEVQLDEENKGSDRHICDNENDVSVCNAEGEVDEEMSDNTEDIIENGVEEVSEIKKEGVLENGEGDSKMECDETLCGEGGSENGDEVVFKNEEEEICDEAPWEKEESVTSWNSSEEDTARVQHMIERMMQDIKQELKQDGGMNGTKRLDDILNLNESSSNGDWEAIIKGDGLNGSLTHLGKSAQDVVKEMAGFLGQNPEQGTEKDMRVLRERLQSLPETRM